MITSYTFTKTIEPERPFRRRAPKRLEKPVKAPFSSGFAAAYRPPDIARGPRLDGAKRPLLRSAMPWSTRQE
jgi:hypothetical protein